MANIFDQDFENYYYRGNPDFKSDEILTNLGFYYDHNEFDECRIEGCRGGK